MWIKVSAASYFLRAILGIFVCLAVGCAKPDPREPSASQWRELLKEALRDNRPDDPHFAENLAHWSNRLFLQAEASQPDSPQRNADARALIEYNVLICYLNELYRATGKASVFSSEDHQILTDSPALSVTTFGHILMARSWQNYASVWKEYGLAPVETPDVFKLQG